MGSLINLLSLGMKGLIMKEKEKEKENGKRAICKHPRTRTSQKISGNHIQYILHFVYNYLRVYPK